MRGRFLILMTLALALAACGGESDTKKSGAVASGQAQAAATSAIASPTPPVAKPPKHVSPKAAAAVADATYIRARTSGSKSPAVVLLPDTGDKAAATSEARRLAELGIASIVVEAPAAVPTSRRAFNDAVTVVQLALAKLRKRRDVDPNRVGFIGEGVGAHVGAVALGREEGSVPAAVLADVGGVVVPSRTFAPERWLERASGTHLLFQRDRAKRAMTQEEIKRLLLASPPGTLMQNYRDLGRAAEAARDRWIKDELSAY